MSLKNLLKKSKKCLICDNKCGKIYTTVKYRYENEQIGEAYLCEKCSKEYDLDESLIDEQPI
jgi:predicted SprT family Zn-dependent metalloprotease